MSTARALQYSGIGPDDYLAMERDAHTRNEYIQGETVAMAGASDAHVTVSGNMFYLIKSHIKGGECRVYMSDMKVRVKQGEAFLYPDVFVTCKAEDQILTYYKDSPKLIIEVISPSTEGFDRGSKFALYRELESLEQYILVDPRDYRVDVFSRNDSNRWELVSYTGKDTTVPVTSLGYILPMSDLYEDVNFELSNGEDSAEKIVG